MVQPTKLEFKLENRFLWFVEVLMPESLAMVWYMAEALSKMFLYLTILQGRQKRTLLLPLFLPASFPFILKDSQVYCIHPFWLYIHVIGLQCLFTECLKITTLCAFAPPCVHIMSGLSTKIDFLCAILISCAVFTFAIPTSSTPAVRFVVPTFL